MKEAEAGPKCCECGAPAVWVRRTQFAGDHPFCDEHARAEKDFGCGEWWCWSADALDPGRRAAHVSAACHGVPSPFGS